MNLNQLRFAKAVAKHRSFSRAAEECCVTQPTLSNAIAQLEKELDGKLFKRTTRSVFPTCFGDAILPLIEGVLEARTELVRSAFAFHNPEQKLVRVGLSPVINTTLVNQVLEPYRSRHAQIDLFLKQCFMDDLDRRLEAGSIDVAMGPRGQFTKGVATMTLYSEPLCFVPEDTDAPEKRNALLLRNIVGSPVILTSGCGLSDVITDLFDSQGLNINRYPGQALSYSVVEEWAGLGLGVGILPRAKLSAANATARPILLDDGGLAEIKYEAVWAPDTVEAPHVAAFRDYLAVTLPAVATGMVG